MFGASFSRFRMYPWPIKNVFFIMRPWTLTHGVDIWTTKCQLSNIKGHLDPKLLYRYRDTDMQSDCSIWVAKEVGNVQRNRITKWAQRNDASTDVANEFLVRILIKRTKHFGLVALSWDSQTERQFLAPITCPRRERSHKLHTVSLARVQFQRPRIYLRAPTKTHK